MKRIDIKDFKFDRSQFKADVASFEQIATRVSDGIEIMWHTNGEGGLDAKEFAFLIDCQTSVCNTVKKIRVIDEEGLESLQEAVQAALEDEYQNAEPLATDNTGGKAPTGATPLQDDISDPDQKAYHLASLLDALWHLLTAQNGRLHDFEVSLLFECQLRARQLGKALDEVSV